jgi:hypothetical protein
MTAITAALSTIMGIAAPGIPDATVQRIVTALAGRAGAGDATDPNVILAASTSYVAAWLESEVQTWEAYAAAHSPLVLTSVTPAAS